MRFFLEISYNGSKFHGWQSQPNAISVQSHIEAALSKLLGKEISIVGSGRTDAGVHAFQTFAHFDTDRNLSEIKQKFLLSLNSLVGKDISIKNLMPVAESAHARFDATERTYKYFVTFKKNPFLQNFSWYSPSSLDMEAMNQASKILLEVADFTSFAKLHSDVKTNICHVKDAFWKNVKEDAEGFNFLGNLDDGIVFTITADRFLRNMVRAIVGTLILIGRHKISVVDFKDIIAKKNRGAAGVSMPAQALFLWQLKYPYIS